MLTDIFSRRYKDAQIWRTFTASEQTLLVQTFRIFSEQISPYKANGTATDNALWSMVQNRLSMELGLVSLSPVSYNFTGEWNGQPHHYYGNWTIDHVCQTWFLQPFDGSIPVDQFIKERISFIELAFRLREDQINLENVKLPSALKAADDGHDPFGRSPRVRVKLSEDMKNFNTTINSNFKSSVQELNARFRQADCNLNYHNGFVQFAKDGIVADHIETPFWDLVSAEKWKNVDTDMKEAFDRRDTGVRDPAFYAVRALESAIKVLSDDKGWTHGKEKGAHNYIDNLSSNSFLAGWEAKAIKHVFTEVRNPLGHGPGTAIMPALSPEQTDWAIEACLSWIKSLIRRL
jgi:hypothetical protein